jgi:hypothetical protein
MKLAMIVNPFTERNRQLAAPVGGEEIVLTYPGPGLAPLGFHETPAIQARSGSDGNPRSKPDSHGSRRWASMKPPPSKPGAEATGIRVPNRIPTARAVGLP